MAFRNAQQARLYFGALGLAAYSRSASAGASIDMVDVTTLADTNREFIPSLIGSQFSAAGPLDVDGSANGQFDLLADELGNTANTPITYMPLGTDGAAWLCDAIETQLDTSGSVTGSADWVMAATTDGPTDTNGVILANNTTITADTDGTTNDNGAATSNGAVAHLHVTAFSGFTSDDIIIEGSATGAFAGEESTIVTFTQVTGLTSQRVAVTGTVPRYLRVADNVTGTGSITRLVAISRR